MGLADRLRFLSGDYGKPEVHFTSVLSGRSVVGFLCSGAKSAVAGYA